MEGFQMVKEIIQMLVNDPGALLRLNRGELQLAGISDVEHRAIMDVVNKREENYMALDVWK